ncbi:hypothetical protein PIB30_088786 [Stylosanthes scabra]|uniref:Uncharacterized protein n=1 Tax=Stylosanthes scabra TaxID=79078 RepID=A0ABU6VUR7_9FABA|nr:hypothetical protein [Stylosanthes scabra]
MTQQPRTQNKLEKQPHLNLFPLLPQNNFAMALLFNSDGGASLNDLRRCTATTTTSTATTMLSDRGSISPAVVGGGADGVMRQIFLRKLFATIRQVHRLK